MSPSCAQLLALPPSQSPRCELSYWGSPSARSMAGYPCYAFGINCVLVSGTEHEAPLSGSAFPPERSEQMLVLCTIAFANDGAPSWSKHIPHIRTDLPCSVLPCGVRACIV